MNSHITHVCLLVATCLTSLSAAEETPRPVAPFFKTPPPGSEWTISINSRMPATQGTEGASRPSILPTRLVQRIGLNKIQENILTYSDQREERFYFVQNTLLQKYDNAEKVALLRPGISLLRSQPFPGVEGLTLKAYVRTEMIKTEACHVFRVEEINPVDQSLAVTTTWISAVTGYPVRVQTEEEELEFSPPTSFPNTVALPAIYQEAMQQGQREQRILEAMRRRNGL